tara:strand:+ start:183 stop:467 length:285 start_codon:yes stop_codon:yes gene_type:complete
LREIKFSSNLPLRQGGKMMWLINKKGETMKEYKRIDVTTDIWINNFGDDNFDLFIRASSPLGAYVYSFKKGRLFAYQRRSYGGASKTKYYNFYD